MPDYSRDWRRYVVQMNLRLRIASQRYRAARAFGLTRRTRQQAVYDWALRSDEQAQTYFYARDNDHLPDLRRPVWLNEKIRWQFLNHPNPLMSLAADKAAVRDYLRALGAKIEPPELLAVGTDPEAVAELVLPRRFVLKSTHGCAQIHIEDGSRSTARAEIVAQVVEWNRCDYWRRCGELHYRDIPKRWLVEEYVPADREKLEFKIFCFMGEPRYVTVVTERVGGRFKRVTFDLDWNRVGFATRGIPPDTCDVPRPRDLDFMLSEAKRLSGPFLHVRVDFLKHDGRLVFSELTFAAMGAVLPFEPFEANVELGAMMDLSAADGRLALGRRIAGRLGWPSAPRPVRDGLARPDLAAAGAPGPIAAVIPARPGRRPREPKLTAPPHAAPARETA